MWKSGGSLVATPSQIYSHGGARKGSGRKKSPRPGKRFSIYMGPDDYQMLKMVQDSLQRVSGDAKPPTVSSVLRMALVAYWFCNELDEKQKFT